MKVVRELKHPLLLLLVIVCEILFKADENMGAIAYAIVLVIGLAVFMFWQNQFLAILLAVPLIRTVGAAAALGFEPKLLIMSVMLLVYIIVLHLHAPLQFLHRRLKPAGVALALGIGVVFGVAMQRVTDFPDDSLLLTAVLAAALAEEVFRAAVLSEEKTGGMIVLSSLLFGLLVFSGSFVVFGLAILFSAAAGFLYVKQKHLLLPVIAHMVLVVIMVLPKFF